MKLPSLALTLITIIVTPGCGIKAAPALIPTLTSPDCELLVVGNPRTGEPPKTTPSGLATCLNELRRSVAESVVLDSRAEEDARQAAQIQLASAQTRLDALAKDALSRSSKAAEVLGDLRQTGKDLTVAAHREAITRQMTDVEVALRDALRDVSAEVNLEEERRLSERQLKESLAALNESRAALQKAVEAVTALNAETTEQLKAAQTADDIAKLKSGLEAAWKSAADESAKALSLRSAALRADARHQELLGRGESVSAAVQRAVASLAASRLTYARHYLAYKRLGKLYWTVKADYPGLDSAFGGLAETLHDALNRNGLFQPFSLMMITGAAINATDNGVDTNTDSSFGLGAVMKVVGESKHFGDESSGKWRDASVGVSIGLEPVRALFIRPGTTSDLGLGFMNALVFSSTGKWNLQAAQTGEVPLFIRMGQSVLVKDSVTVTGADGKPAAVTPIESIETTNTSFLEVGAEWNYYGKPLELVHAEKAFFDPPLSFGVALRQDWRLETAHLPPVLTSSGQPVPYRNSVGEQNRVVLRAAIAPTKFAKNPDKPGELISFGFSVEHEFALRCSRNCVPSSTRFMFRGDLDLVKAFTNPQ